MGAMVKGKASVAHDFMKVSRDLEEALARGAFTACELRIIAWLKARTYGVRIKQEEHWVALDATPITSTFISTETGLNKARVRDAVTALLADLVLRRKANGWVGINSRIGDWKRPRVGRDFDFDRRPRGDLGLWTRDTLTPGQGVPYRGGQGVPYEGGQPVPPNGGQGVPGLEVPSKERARVETLEKQRGEGPTTLSNGKTDTPFNRAEAGLADFPPMDHPAYAGLSYKLQDKFADRWEQRVAEERKKNNCRKCGQVPRADKWPLCRGCTTCDDCGAPAGGGRKFTLEKGKISCNECTEKKP